MDNSTHIPSRFRDEILAHIIGVYSSKSEKFPLILGIFGNPGEGKTYMCEQVLLDFHIKKNIFSVNEFENESSGVPAKKLREKYDELVQKYTEHGVYGVLMINDIDAAIGNWGEMYQYTVNTQLIIGELMQISDPHTNQKKRVPIIITGNNFSAMYAPLRRSGRISGFYWQTSEPELVEILCAEYDELNKAEVSRLVKELNSCAAEKLLGSLPVSFFTALRSKLYKESIYKLFSQPTYRFLKQHTFVGDMISSFDMGRQNREISADELIQIGKREIDSIVAMNEKHLGIEVRKNGSIEDQDKDHHISKKDSDPGEHTARL